jgi:hypothetical protein
MLAVPIAAAAAARGLPTATTNCRHSSRSGQQTVPAMKQQSLLLVPVLAIHLKVQQQAMQIVL